MRSYRQLHPWRELELETVAGVGWALLVEAVETLWGLLLLAEVAAMAVGEAMVAPAEGRAMATL